MSVHISADSRRRKRTRVVGAATIDRRTTWVLVVHNASTPTVKSLSQAAKSVFHLARSSLVSPAAIPSARLPLMLVLRCKCFTESLRQDLQAGYGVFHVMSGLSMAARPLASALSNRLNGRSACRRCIGRIARPYHEP